MILLVPEGQAGTSTSTFEETFQSRQEGSQRWMPVPETKPCATTTGDHLWLVQEGGQPEAVLQSAGSLFKGDGLAGELLARCLSEVLLHCCTLSFLLCFLCFLGLGPWPRWEKGYEKVIALQGARTLGSPSAASSDSSSFFGAPSKTCPKRKERRRGRCHLNGGCQSVGARPSQTSKRRRSGSTCLGTCTAHNSPELRVAKDSTYRH